MNDDYMVYCIILAKTPDIIAYSDQERLVRWYAKFKRYKKKEYSIQKVRYLDLVGLCNKHRYLMDEINEYQDIPLTDGEMEIVSENLEQDLYFIRNSLYKIKENLRQFKSPKIKKLMKDINDLLEPSMDDLEDKSLIDDPKDTDEIYWNYMTQCVKYGKYARKILVLETS